MKFKHFLDSLNSYVLWQLVRQLVYTVFKSENRGSFHLRWKENLVKHKKVSKYYESYCLQNFHLIFISLLTPSVAKNCDI